ncbi:MAG: STAS domain-containing protein [bacterium]
MVFGDDRHGEVTVISVNLSRATVEKAASFKNYLTKVIEGGANKIIIDLSQCDFIDSTFLGALVASLKRVVQMNGDLRLVWNSATQSEIFYLTRMDKVFKIFNELDDAIESFKQRRSN